MGFRMIAPKRVRKAKTRNGREVLRRLGEYLESAAVTGEPVEILCRFWEDQKDAVTYKELRQWVRNGEMEQETLRLWMQDYSKLVAGRLSRVWTRPIAAGPGGQPILDGRAFELNMQEPGILGWVNERGAEFATACTQEQKDAIAALLTKKIRDGHTVDELSRMIRPCIGLTEGDAKAVTRYYDNIVATMKKEHPRMKPESIRKKALDAMQKYAERKHRQRAMAIAQTESAFAYNRGADEGVRQAQEQGLLGRIVKRWSTSGDDGVCSICASLEGVEIEMDSSFNIKGRELFKGQHRLPPAHPRCGCAVEYVEVEPAQNAAAPMKTGDRWIDNAIEDYDKSLVRADGDDAMGTRLLMSHEEVRYVKDASLAQAFSYNIDKDMILYNPKAPHAGDYDMGFVLTHENAHRVDCLYLHSWESKRFMAAANSLESIIMSNLGAVEELLQDEAYGEDFAFNDLISSLTRGAANDILFVGHGPEYLSNDRLRAMEVFADITCIDMSGSAARAEFDGLLKDLYDAYKEVVAWKE